MNLDPSAARVNAELPARMNADEIALTVEARRRERSGVRDEFAKIGLAGVGHSEDQSLGNLAVEQVEKVRRAVVIGADSAERHRSNCANKITIKACSKLRRTILYVG